MSILLLLQAVERTTSVWWCIVVLGLIFTVAFVVTYMLYRHFTKTYHE